MANTNKPIPYSWINPGGGGLKPWFEAAMCSSVPEAFHDCDDNYEVEKRLRKAGVLRLEDKTDTESCALVVYFKTMAEGHAFIDRLNAYLDEVVN